MATIEYVPYVRKIRDPIVCAAEGCDIVIQNPAYNQKFCCYRCGKNRTLRGLELSRKYWENRRNALWLRQREGQETLRVNLLPCPFCGKYPDFVYEARDEGSDITYIWCCFGTLNYYGGDYETTKPAEEAIEKWNRRPENGQNKTHPDV